MNNTKLVSASIIALTILLSFTFIAAGFAKLFSVEQVILPFERMNMPFMAMVVGLLEVSASIALFIPRLRFFAAVGLSMTMVGAILYHITLDPQQAALPGVVLLIMCASLTWIRRPLSAPQSGLK
ncbi:DoxX family protein [Vibrio sp. VB16]|uniref:DoxX family protein n=1 Tax=Vibrio sp. VB16 TaxID=2785746 RepID=UPI0018A0E49E|nr:DoxX family protein [Vibrio sp. VB16]UGA53571.1 DoxX family protein [Vibrio sp. VB16]